MTNTPLSPAQRKEEPMNLTELVKALGLEEQTTKLSPQMVWDLCLSRAQEWHEALGKIALIECRGGECYAAYTTAEMSEMAAQALDLYRAFSDVVVRDKAEKPADAW